MTISMPFDLTEWLNKPDNQQRLDEIYSTDFYWYLRHPKFIKEFLKPMADFISQLNPNTLLDVGCGEGQLADLIDQTVTKYTGVDGSINAIAKADIYHEGTFYHGRLENPRLLPQQDILVFGGILEVLVKPEHRVDFVDFYVGYYESEYIAIYDLERLDTSPFDNHDDYELHFTHRASVEINGLIDTKRHRKVLVYKCL